MGLKEDAKRIVSEIFGSEVAEQLNAFDDPKKYPKDFLEECVYFLGRLIGEEEAKKKFMPLYRKYVKEH